MTIEQSIYSAVDNGKEFLLLEDVKMICTNSHIEMEELDYCLDAYNSISESQIPYYAKFNYIANNYGIKIK